MKADVVLGEHNFNFDREKLGGLALKLTTKFVTNGDPGKDGLYWNQFLTLQAECNSTTFNFYLVPFTPDKLRQLANELEKAEIEVLAKQL